MLGQRTKRNQGIKYKNLREAEATKSFSSGKRKEKEEKRKLNPGRLPEEKLGLQTEVGVGGVLVEHPGHSRIQFATGLPSVSAGHTEMLWLSGPRNVSFS